MACWGPVGRLELCPRRQSWSEALAEPAPIQTTVTQPSLQRPTVHLPKPKAPSAAARGAARLERGKQYGG